ncbi:hypothetical protein RRG08_056574 [Elysia crispata]|uniref:Uncharacterized protein n=1 Tax=Elysia crispata TaxID=231223 RepID=A0AAE1AM02_9GAST|nr:hypothetical protein RRG08_056574 [Elysia crispata]
MHPSLKICRHFGSNHGKSLCHSSGGTVKNCASAAVKNGQAIIRSSKDMFEFCNDYVSISPPINGCEHLVRSFVHFDAVKRPTYSCELKALKITRDFHCIRLTGAGLDVRALSCFCSVCLVNEEGVCENEEFVLGWSLMNVKEGPVELDVDDASECSQDSLEGIFDADTMYSSHLGHALGLWQVEAFANVLGVKIVSIYPTKGLSVMRKLLDCHVMPREDRRIYPHDVPILWTSNRSDMNETYWVANHIVPLLPFSLIDFVEFQS